MSRFILNRGFLLTLLALVPLAVASRANDVIPAAGGVRRAPRVLVLPDGRTITGDIRITQNGYEAALGPDTGRMFIAEEMVWFTAESLPAAYDELFKRFPDHTADGYVQLANWCLQQNLYDQAYANLETALRLKPDHPAARVAAKELGKLMSRHPGLSRPAQSAASNLPNAHPAAGSKTPRTAVSVEAVNREFVSRIQPILVNSCGNAACHGRSSDSPFRLKNVRPGHPSFKSFTESNYETIKQLIRLDEPPRSPLLVAPRDARHAALREPLFMGPAGAGQWRALSVWVHAVARLNQAESDATATEISVSQPPIQLAGHTETTPTNPERRPSAAAPASAADEAAIRAILEQAMKSGEPDAFDPHEFNRRFASQTDRSSTPLSNGPTR